MLTARQAVPERAECSLLRERAMRLSVIPRPHAAEARAVGAPQPSVNDGATTGRVDLVRHRDYVSAPRAPPASGASSAQSALVVPEDSINSIPALDRHVPKASAAVRIYAHPFTGCTSIQGHEYLGAGTRINSRGAPQVRDAYSRAHLRGLQQAFSEAHRDSIVDSQRKATAAPCPRTRERESIAQPVAGHIGANGVAAAMCRVAPATERRGRKQKENGRDGKD
jgi:hypothetical protein